MHNYSIATLARHLSIASLSLLMALYHVMPVSAADPMATNFTLTQCEGSAMPYPVPEEIQMLPDSLSPVMINHVGRHGARYLSSSKSVDAMLSALGEADSLGTITPSGVRMRGLCKAVKHLCNGRWGALDSLGMAEQRGIASRMYKTYSSLFADGRVSARSSRVPRCVNSMFTFLYQLARLNSNLEISTASGPAESPALRAFDTDAVYLDWRDEEAWVAPYQEFVASSLPLTPLIRLLGRDFPISADAARELAMDLYNVIAGLDAMGVKINTGEFLNPGEYNALWACNNLRQYLLYTATTLSITPAETAAPLLMDIINTTQEAVDADKNTRKGERRPGIDVILRFGHAETLMPLLSLMRLPGSYYMTNYFDTVGLHWQNFHNVPMAANLQLILLKSKKGAYYVRLMLNEVSVGLDSANPEEEFIPWEEAKDRLMRCVPLYLRI